MPFSWDQIRQRWLGDDEAPEPQGVLEAVNRVESILGTSWVLSSGGLGQGVPPGPFPLLHVALAGYELEALSGLAEVSALVARLKRGDRDAWAELLAIRLARGPSLAGEVELEPLVEVRKRTRRPDFRIRQNAAAPWTYVEVSAPDDSEDQRRLRGILEETARALADEPGPYKLEALLRREPAPEELIDLVATLRTLARAKEETAVDLPAGIGRVFANHGVAALVELVDHGEPPASRLALTQVRVVGEGPTSELTLRIAFGDDRASRFVDDEAAQLPVDAPGLIMLHVGSVVTRRGLWERAVRDRFRPTMHTRVSGACLFDAGVVPGSARLEVRVASRLVSNPHAKNALSEWLVENLRAWPVELIPGSAAPDESG